MPYVETLEEVKTLKKKVKVQLVLQQECHIILIIFLLRFRKYRSFKDKFADSINIFKSKINYHSLNRLKNDDIRDMDDDMLIK